jgi:16S rRNA (guanine966-N2)-methyltransferase
MGLECLSRGATHAAFFEADRGALERLKKNIAVMKLESRAQVIAGDLFKWFSTSVPTDRANLIFLDPPYRFLQEQLEKLRKLADALAKDHLVADGLIIFRHDAKDELELPPLKSIDRREYGGMVLEFLTNQ